LIVHSSAAEDSWRPRWIDGNATFTTVVSMLIMNVEKHIAASVHHRRFSSVIATRRRRFS